jgi:hypothetical protein
MKYTFGNILANMTTRLMGTNNKFNEAFYKFLGSGYTHYDINNATYIVLSQ